LVELGQPQRAAVRARGVCVSGDGARAGGGADERRHLLAPGGIRDAENRHVGDVLVLEEDVPAVIT
jgi:hypothetical protein